MVSQGYSPVSQRSGLSNHTLRADIADAAACHLLRLVEAKRDEFGGEVRHLAYAMQRELMDEGSSGPIACALPINHIIVGHSRQSHPTRTVEVETYTLLCIGEDEQTTLLVAL